MNMMDYKREVFMIENSGWPVLYNLTHMGKTLIFVSLNFHDKNYV